MLTGSMPIFATDMSELCSTLSLYMFINTKLLAQASGTNLTNLQKSLNL